MTNKKVYISQKDNYAGAFGLVYRSSANFYFRQSNTFKTTISFMDYWRIKRGISVMVVASTRSMDGKLLMREQLTFKNGSIINFSPDMLRSGIAIFEGAIEIEVFASENMVIPYSAIMAVYEAENSISMVHSYSRTYSPHEVEEGRTISAGEEGCWSILDTQRIASFAIIHNGSDIQPEQSASLELTNVLNKKTSIQFSIPTLPPYATFKIIPQQYLPSIISFLDGKPGNAAVSFTLKNSFTRMLVGNNTTDGSEFQVTHSNFNFARHETDNAGEGYAFMLVPPAKFRDLTVVVYPETTKGQYKLETPEGKAYEFKSGERLEITTAPGILKFSKLDGKLPARIVTALTAKAANSNAILPFECSLGVLHKLRPLKGTFWGIVAIGKKYRSRLIIYPMEVLYGEAIDNELQLYLYTQESREPEVRLMHGDEILQLGRGMYLEEIFPRFQETHEDQYGYFYIRCSNYGGMYCYTTLENELGSVSLEHSF